MVVIVVVGDDASHVIYFWDALEALNKEELAELINFCSGRRCDHIHTYIHIYICIYCIHIVRFCMYVGTHTHTYLVQHLNKSSCIYVCVCMYVCM